MEGTAHVFLMGNNAKIRIAAKMKAKLNSACIINAQLPNKYREMKMLQTTR